MLKYPILILNGEQASTESTLAEQLLYLEHAQARKGEMQIHRELSKVLSWLPQL